MGASAKRRDVERFLQDELDLWENFDYEFEGLTKGGHLCLRVTGQYGARKLFYSQSPSDHRSGLNNVPILRNLLSIVGATKRVEPVKEKPAPQKQTAVARPAPREVVRTTPPPVQPQRREAPVRQESNQPATPLDPLRALQRRNTLRSLSMWAGKRANRDRLDEAARMLIEGWHPDIVARAYELTQDALKD